MTRKQAIDFLKIEMKCIERNENNNCDRQCQNCDLVQETKDLITAYKIAIDALEKKE